MFLPCEFAVRSVVPAMRALIARELCQNYHMKQNDIASLLGITQSAVSQYMRSVRGKAIDLEEIEEARDLTKTIADRLAHASLSQREVTQKCCEVCRMIRKKRVLCHLHHEKDPTYDIEGCDACIP